MLTGLLIGTSVAAVLGFILSQIFSWFRVEEGHSAILTRFGAPRKNSNGEILIFSSGLHGKKPWDHVHVFSKMERTLKIGNEGRTLEVLARDGTLLRVNASVRFNFRDDAAEKFLFGVRDPMKHLDEIFRSILTEEIGKFGSEKSENGNYSELRRNRKKLDQSLNARANDLRDRYGIEFKAIDIAEILPPSDLANALNGIQKIKAEFETLLKRVEAECERKVAAAQHGVAIAKTRAQATEKEIRVLGSAISELNNWGSLDAYMKRRQDEATFASRSVYVKT